MKPPADLSFDADAVAARFAAMRQQLGQRRPGYGGRVVSVVGGFIHAEVPQARIGHLCRMEDPRGEDVGEAEIISIDGNRAVLAAFGSPKGLSRSVDVFSTGAEPGTRVADENLGCVVDWRGLIQQRFADPVRSGLDITRPIHGTTPSPSDRLPIAKTFDTGIRAIDSLLTVGEGQRIGIFGGAGTGKSSLVEILLRGAKPDVLVLALVGERGREVGELVEKLRSGPNASRTCIYAATSDRSAVERLNAVHAATACAEAYRDLGLNVLLVVDSVTRIARAMREIGLARGEMPTRRGYPVSVFEQLPQLFERAGRLRKGSITAAYTVLLEGEIADDPIAEETMSLIDGHVILSRAMTMRGVYPAIDVSRSISRSMSRIVDAEQLATAQEFRKLTATYDDVELMLRMGEYKRGTDETTDRAIDLHDAMIEFLRQSPEQSVRLAESQQQLRDLLT